VALDEALLRTTLEALYPRPTVDEAIVDAVRLAVATDGRSTADELLMLVTLQKLLGELAGVEDLPLSAACVEQRRLFELGDQLEPARELAFACAYLVMAQDLDLTEGERKLATTLGAALVLDPERVAQLAAEMEALARMLRA
jgi:hypothetical protein